MHLFRVKRNKYDVMNYIMIHMFLVLFTVKNLIPYCKKNLI